MKKIKIDFGIGLSNISLFENLNSLNNTFYGTNNNSNSINFTYSFGIHYYIGINNLNEQNEKSYI